MTPSYKYQKVSDANDSNEDLDLNDNIDDSRLKFDEQSTYTNKFDLQQQTVWYKRPSVFWLLPVFLLFNLAMGATVMPRTNIVISLICRKILSARADAMQHPRRHEAGTMMAPAMMDNGTASYTAAGAVVVIGEYNPQCSIDAVESATAMLQLYGNLVAGILGAIAAPIGGKLSDRYGRIRPLAAASTVVLVSEIVMVVIAKLPDTFSIYWLYTTFFLEGLSGTFILSMALASSYAADCTSGNDRNVGIGWFHGSMFFGFAAGPMFGGFIGMRGGPMVIFYTALIMRVVGVLFLIFVVPESFPGKSEQTASITSSVKHYFDNAKQQSWMDNLKGANLLQIFAATNTSRRCVRRNLIALASVNTIMFAAFMGAMNVMLLYSEFIFGWGNKESGVFLSTVNLLRTLATVLVLPLTIRFLKRYNYFNPTRHQSASSKRDCPETGSFDRLDVFLIRISILSDIIGYVGYAIAPTGPLFTLSGAVAALGAVGLATSEASMTKIVGSEQTGELLGALAFLQAMARIIAPTVSSLIYSRTVSSTPALVFWGVAMCFAAAGIATFWAEPERGSGMSGHEEEAVPLQARDQ